MFFSDEELLSPEAAARATEMVPDGLVAADGDARVIYCNRRFERITGLKADEIRGRDIREVLSLQDSDGSSWWDLTDPWSGLRTRTGHRERLLMLANGREALVTAKYMRPGRNMPVNRVVVVLRDAEHRRRTEANHAALISTVAHELRSPLTSVKGFSSTLLRRWERFSDEQKRLMIETIEADADRVTRLISELLDVSRIDAGRLQIRPQPIDVCSVFERHVERAVATGHDRERFVIDVPADLPEVWADPDRLDQILANLIENALRHGDGAVTLAATPAHDGEGEGGGRRRLEGKVDLVVSDDGKGIDPAHRDLVFSRFWHGSGRGSTGLGLYVVKGLVDAHGGRILVETAPSGGAQFRFSMPSEPPEYLA
jgi:PAS domain S-box-containing protein